MRNKKIFAIIITIVVILGIWFFIRFVVGGPEDDWICANGQWVKHGAPNKSMPTESCSGKEDLIQVESPKVNEVISSPLVIKGKARGVWFFEATFPIMLTDWDGRIIAEGYATAQGEWMTEDFVPFEGTIEFEKPEMIGEFAKRGALILKKDNPSGLSEHDDALEIPIVFSSIEGD